MALKRKSTFFTDRKNVNYFEKLNFFQRKTEGRSKAILIPLLIETFFTRNLNCGSISRETRIPKVAAAAAFFQAMTILRNEWRPLE